MRVYVKQLEKESVGPEEFKRLRREGTTLSRSTNLLYTVFANPVHPNLHLVDPTRKCF